MAAQSKHAGVAADLQSDLKHASDAGGGDHGDITKGIPVSALMEVVPQLVWTGRPDGYIDYCNPRWLSYTGLSEQEIQGDGWADALHPDDRETTFEAWRAATSKGSEYVVEQRLRGADGVYHWFLTRAVPLRDEHGHAIKWVGTCTDIQERKEAEEELARALARTDSVLSNITEGYLVLDSEFRFVHVNPAARGIFRDMPESELVGRQLWDVFPEGKRSEFYRAYRCAMDTGRPVHVEAHSRIVDRWYEAHAYPRDGMLEVYVRDITQRKKSEEALREADRRKDEFLAVLAHELRNPLAPIRTGLELLRLARNDPDTAERVLATMERQTSQLVRLVDDLLDVSRITTGKVELQLAREEIGVIVQTAIESVRPLFDEGGQHLSVKLPEERIFVHADAARLSQVVANLLSNAAKYSAPGGRVDLQVLRAGAEVEIDVSDRGAGIPRQMLDRIFDMFMQVDPRLAPARSGLGIGLTLVKTLVELHGGTVSAHSDGLGRGSKFVVRMPIAPAPDAKEGSSAPKDGAGKLHHRILVVDDNRDAADGLSMLIEALGGRVRTAYGGVTALQTAHSFRPDVVLLDLGMPEMDGFETARRLRAGPGGRDLVLVALTGWGQDEDRRRTREAGFDHHLVKPVGSKTLESLLQQVPRKR